MFLCIFQEIQSLQSKKTDASDLEKEKEEAMQRLQVSRQTGRERKEEKQTSKATGRQVDAMRQVERQTCRQVKQSDR